MAAGASFELNQSAPGVLGVSGVLSFDNAQAVLRDLRGAMRAREVTQLDLAGVTRSDSAGLACILAVLAEQSQPVHVAHVPASMHALATVCAVDTLLV